MTDPFLDTIVDFVDRGEFARVSMTLTVGGLIFSGIVVSAREYFETVGGDMLGSLTSTRTGAPVGADDRLLNGLKWSAFADDLADAGGSRYIHLSEVLIVGASPLLRGTATTRWRFRLDSVSGFTLNRVTVSKPGN